MRRARTDDSLSADGVHMKSVRIAAALAVGLGPVLTAPVLALADVGLGTRQPDRHVYDNAFVVASASVANLERQAAGMDKAGAPTVVYVRIKAANSDAIQQDARGFGTRQPDRHVYDNASVLASADLENLERQAAGMTMAGAPTVVYLRIKAANSDATRQDARDLMDAWQVESAPDAKDGLVLLLNLKPGDTRQGSAALVAGAYHTGNGRLNADRLQAIYDGQMKPKLAAGDLAGAISNALEAAAMDLKQPVDTADQNLDWQLAFIPLVIGIITAVGWLVIRLWGSTSRGPGGNRGSGSSSSYNSFSSIDSGSSTSSGSDSAGGNF